VQWHAEALAERRTHLAFFSRLVDAAGAGYNRASKASRAA
jgi:hypothetical protein